MSEYLKQATDFLTKTNTELSVKFLKHGKHFTDDKDSRDIYEITLKRGNRKYIFNFGQSINASGEYIVAPHLQNKIWCEQVTGGKYALTLSEFKKLHSTYKNGKDIFINKNFAVPNAYDILTCLTKYDPNTFEDFCSEFGYDSDSRKALETYNAVKNEYKEVTRLFTDAEIEELQEIQ